MREQGLTLIALSTEDDRSTLTATASRAIPDDRELRYEIDWRDGSPPDTGAARSGMPFSVAHHRDPACACPLELRILDSSGQTVSALCLSTGN